MLSDELFLFDAVFLFQYVLIFLIFFFKFPSLLFSALPSTAFIEFSILTPYFYTTVLMVPSEHLVLYEPRISFPYMYDFTCI